jgi:hypothetical protein
LGLASHASAAVDLLLWRFLVRRRSFESFRKGADQNRWRCSEYGSDGELYRRSDSVQRVDPNRGRMVKARLAGLAWDFRIL